MSEMRLWSNETDTFVARDAAHATELHEAIYGALYNVCEHGEWHEDARPHTKSMTINLDDGRGKVTQTIAEWIAENPQGGMLCTTEW